MVRSYAEQSLLPLVSHTHHNGQKPLAMQKKERGAPGRVGALRSLAANGD